MTHRSSLSLAVTSILLSAACAPSVEAPAPRAAATGAVAAPPAPQAIDDGVPLGKLPKDVRPLASALALTVVPDADRFSGKATIEIELDAPRKVIWLHGKDLRVTAVTVTPAAGGAEAAPIAAKWEVAHPSGVVALRLAAPVGPGKATIAVTYDAPWAKGLQGLYRTQQAGLRYAFTQFEAIDARLAFPCFDEPRFKIPFTLSLTIPEGQNAVANTHVVGTAPALGGTSGMTTWRFAPTLPLPSYLVAFAVGPLDIVEAAPVPPNGARKAPLPLRGVAAKGRGKELGYALAHAGEILSVLETYTGIAYPYDKMDILAVPERDGAMENPGAVTFTESLLLMDEKTAPASQKRAFAGVVAHEFAHQWFGDLVTSAWWDDIWLNEAFATWLGNRATQLWDPSTEADLNLVESVHATMNTDGLDTTRRIREPIESTHDIANAFDGITYQKGAGVLGMFERWVGRDVFQKGVNGYLTKNAFKSATANEFLSALSEAAGKDVATPFKTFLDQPGVPYIDVALRCDQKPQLDVKQSRYQPLGARSKGEQRWQIPVCAKYNFGGALREQCDLVTEKASALSVPSGACPAWVFPNADAAGYYRFSFSGASLAKLRTGGIDKLTTRDKVALVDALRAGFQRGATPAKDIYEALPVLAKDEHPQVALEPGAFLDVAADWLAGTPEEKSVRAYSQRLYGRAYADLGWNADAAATEAMQRTDRRVGVARILALGAEDRAVRKEAARRGRAYIGFGTDGALHLDAVDPNLAALALTVAVQDGDRAFFDALLAQLDRTEDAALRSRILRALASTKDPALAARARELTLDGRLRATEVYLPIAGQMEMAETREATWAWVKANFDALLARISERRAGRFAWFAARFCDEGHAKDLEAFLAPRVSKIEGGPRSLAQALETVHQCVARKGAQEESMRAFFAAAKR